MFWHAAVLIILPLQKLKVVSVDQDLKLGSVVLPVTERVVAVRPFARRVEASLAVELADVVGAGDVAIVDAHCCVRKGALPLGPVQVDVVPKRI